MQRGIRYADDIVFFLEESGNENELQNRVDQFLSERELKVKDVKTHLVNSKEGFDFLRLRLEVKNNYSLTCFPFKKNRRQMINKIKITMRNPSKKMDKRLNKVNVIYKGWRNYHQYFDLSKVNLWSINKWVYQFIKKANSKLMKKNRAKAK